jgi:hypothetical protein
MATKVVPFKTIVALPAAGHDAKGLGRPCVLPILMKAKCGLAPEGQELIPIQSGPTAECFDGIKEGMGPHSHNL